MTWQKEFIHGRHSEQEWDAFFAYLEMPRWKQILSDIVGAFLYLKGVR